MPRRRPLKHREKTGARADVFSVLENSFARSAQKQVHQYFATRLPLLPVAFTAPSFWATAGAQCPWGIVPGPAADTKLLCAQVSHIKGVGQSALGT